MAEISEKKFPQQEFDLDQFTDEELRSRYRFGRESIRNLVEIFKNDLESQTRRKHKNALTALSVSLAGRSDQEKVSYHLYNFLRGLILGSLFGKCTKCEGGRNI